MSELTQYLAKGDISIIHFLIIRNIRSLLFKYLRNMPISFNCSFIIISRLLITVLGITRLLFI